MGLVSQHEEKRGTEYYHYDNLGSTTYLTKNGVKTETFAYGTYGELLLGESGTIRFLYNGRFGVATDDNNLYYMRARYYNVDIKRFINQDIITGEIANSQSLNRYAYCQGNPVNYMDPFGLSPQNIFTAAGHAILNVLGFMPGGEVFDLVNAIWYAIEGNWTEAMICLVGAVPLLGTFAEAHNLTKLSKGLKFASNAGKMYIGGAGAKQNLDNIYDMLASGTGQWYDYLREGGSFVLNVFTCAGGTVGVMDGLNDAVKQMQKASTEKLAKEIANQTVVRDFDWAFSGESGSGSGRTIPQGFTQKEFDVFSEDVIRFAQNNNLPNGKLMIHGSRAKGTATDTSDIDIILRVDQSTFDAFAAQRLSTIPEGTRLHKTIIKAVGKQKLSVFDISKDFGKNLHNDLIPLSPIKNIDFSIIVEGSPFDKGPFIDIN